MPLISKTTRRRRPPSTTEVGLLVILLAGMSALAIFQPGYTTGTPTQATGLALMNINQDGPLTIADASDSPALPQAVSAQPDNPGAIEPSFGHGSATPVVVSVASEQDTPTFNGRPLRLVKRINMLTTAYSPDARSCGKWADGVTASGYSVWTNGMKLVAADTRLLPFGTIVSIPGYHEGRPVPVLDRGGKIKGQRLDLLYPTHEIARRWGAQRLTVDVWEYAD